MTKKYLSRPRHECFGQFHSFCALLVDFLGKKKIQKIAGFFKPTGTKIPQDRKSNSVISGIRLEHMTLKMHSFAKTGHDPNYGKNSKNEKS